MEVEEGQEEELFWMFLGDNDGYAHASYWKWRKNEKGVTDPRIWKIDCAKDKEEVGKTFIDLVEKLLNFSYELDL